MSKLYHYVGPEEIRTKVAPLKTGRTILSLDDLKSWLKKQEAANETIVATFVLDDKLELRLADRHSEHVACAEGRPVYSAGEIFFSCDSQFPEILEISNQSTGYCPDVTSWETLQGVLDSLGISHPGKFTLEVTFRLCPACGERNIVKDKWFFCALCNASLPLEWNFGGIS